MSEHGISRRNFLKSAGLTGAALTLGLYFSKETSAGEIIAASGEDSSIEMNAWIHIDTSGKVSLFNHRAEMGQGSFQSVPQILAEELEADLNQVNVISAPGDRKKFGNQTTGGSSTIRASYKNLLKLGASAREALIITAARRWGVPKEECYARSGRVIHTNSGKHLHYGELVIEASGLPAVNNVVLKNPSAYKLIRKPLHRLDTPLKTNGSAIFGMDKRLPGMLFAAVERNPRMRGKLLSYDDSAARNIPGVKDVFPIKMGVWDTDREGIAVIADSTWSAMQGKKALRIEWDDTGFEHINTDDVFKKQYQDLHSKTGLTLKQIGDPDTVITKSRTVLDVVYVTPYQSHSPMEPVNCTAYYQGDKVELWGPIQAPDMVQDYLAKKLGWKQEQIIVNLTFLGGGFGRKAFTDYPHEAVMISKQINAPVQVIWTREDDMTQGPYRPGLSYRAQAVVSGNNVEALKFSVCGQNISHWSSPERNKPNRSASEGFLAPYYKSIANLAITDVPFETPLPILWWRSVYASTNGFAFESFLDEVAHAGKMDPLALRRKYLNDERCQSLISKMEEVSGWLSRSESSGYGTAITECFETTVGQIVKVSRDKQDKVKIDQVWVVIDCGWYVNPDIIRAQVEGSVIMALAAATMQEIEIKDGRVQQRNFYNYRMPRINEVPPIEVHIMENDHDAGGVGEPGLPPFTPALTNAIFDLTGKRIRKLPFDMSTI